jgi:hypothetical protein
VDNTVDLQTIEEKGSVNIYPNPLNQCEYLTISSADKIFEIRLLNIYGQVFVSKKELHINQAKLSVNDLSAGLYFVEITTNKGMSRLKLVVE